MITTSTLLGFFLYLCSGLDSGQDNEVKPGKLIIEPSTLICIGFEWYIEGDANRNATVEVRYREKESEIWKDHIPLLRIGNEKAGTPEWKYVTENMFAGSIIDLKPGIEYECRLIMKDPDGVSGEGERNVIVKTRREPEPYPHGEIRHVYPENWKGEKIKPAYRGLLHAYYGYPRFADWILTTDPVQPGDQIIIHAGLYKADYKDYREYHGLTFDGTYYFTQNGTPDKPIVIRSAGDGEVIFNGNSTGILFDLTAADYHFLDGLTIRNAEIAIRAGMMNAYGCKGLTVKNCSFEDIGIGIQAQFEGSRHFYIADNTFIGREDTSKVYHSQIEGIRSIQRIASYYAVKIHGQGHTVCYNKVKYFFDGLDICTHAQPETDPDLKSVAIDFYNNDIFLCNDNFIEADGGTHNIRIMRNRCFNSGQQALSNQPVLGGPVYWIRNIVYNCGDASTFKFWGMYPAGILAFHNTSTGILTRDDKPGSNIQMYNNLFLPSDDASLPTLGMYTYTQYTSLDYNGYRYRKPFISWYAPEGKLVVDFWDDHEKIEFNTLADFHNTTGQEKNGILVDYDIFILVTPPSFVEYNKIYRESGRVYPVYYPDHMDFRLKENSRAIDAGCRLPGINDDYTGNAPDLGALEYGKELPHYGPREE
jgi:hypothetical protein